MRKIILGSASPRRKELLEQAGIRFEVITSNAKEVITKEKPSEIVEELSLLKGKAVSEAVREDAVVISADTIVAMNGAVMGKPKNQADALRMLNSLQGRTHQVYTGVTLILKVQGEEQIHTFYEKTDVTMYPMTEAEILEYIATGEPMDKAGAYGIQGRAGVFVKQIHGDYNNVVGLPIARLYHELQMLTS